MITRNLSQSLLILLMTLPGCEEGPPPEAAQGRLDGGTRTDGSSGDSGGPRPDAAEPDEGVRPDQGPDPDAGPDPDQGAPPPELTIELSGPATLAVGALDALQVTVRDADGQPVERAVGWQNDQPLVLYVDGEGGLLGVSPGTATVRAVLGDVESPAVTIEITAASPPAARFFAAVEPLLRANCGVPGCHVDGIEPGDLRFDRDPDRVWEELVEDGAEEVPGRRVSPDRPQSSYLIEKLSSPMPRVGGRMPLGQPPLSAAEVQPIVTWILGGAARN